jgi:hypothetical protein
MESGPRQRAINILLLANRFSCHRAVVQNPARMRSTIDVLFEIRITLK